MNALRVATAIGIAVLVPLLANMTVQIFFEPPDYDEFFNYYSGEPRTAEERAKAETDMRERQNRMEEATARFNTSAFLITFPMGIAGLIGAYLLRRRPTLAAGLFFGSLATLAFASYSSWDTLPGWLRYITLLATLALLAVIAVKLERAPSTATG